VLLILIRFGGALKVSRSDAADEAAFRDGRKRPRAPT